MVKHLRRLLYFPFLRHLRRLRYVLGRMSYAQPEFFDILSTPPCRLKGVTPKAKAEGT